MNLRKRQNLIILIVIIIIVSGFSISNYINEQKIYVLSEERNNDIVEKGSDIDIYSNIHEISTKKIVVHIEGAVVSPGVYELEEDTRIFDAIEAAGGLLKTADRKKINLAKKIVDEEYVYIPNENEESVELYNVSSISTMTNKNGNGVLININKASVAELKALSGVGDVLANRIIEYRSGKGDFKSVEELKNVSGIGDKKFSEIKDKITVR